MVRIYQGNSADALMLLKRPLPSAPADPALAATRGSLLAIAYSRTGDPLKAQQALTVAAHTCPNELARVNVRLSQGIVDLENSSLADAERDFSLTLQSAETLRDRFLQTQALLNLGVTALREEHYDDALERFTQASTVAQAIGARLLLEKAEGAIGSTFYKVGDYRRALVNSRQAEEQATALGSPLDQVAWLHDVGLSQFRLGQIRDAQASYEQALQLTRTFRNDGEDLDTGDALTALAWLSLQQGDLTSALSHAHEAQRLAARWQDTDAALEPSLIEALVFARSGQAPAAESHLLRLEASSSIKQSARWEIQHSLARVYAEAGDRAQADTWFLRAIATFRQQRSSVSTLDSLLPFFENGSSLYLDYMEQLIREGRSQDALQVFDQSRAETLAEGLHLSGHSRPMAGGGPKALLLHTDLSERPVARSLAADAGTHKATTEASAGSPRSSDPRLVAQRLHGTILVYSLRPGTSYLWAVSPSRSAFFQLPGREYILPLVASHTRAIMASKDVLSQQNAPGLALYHLLVEPAQALLRNGDRVFIIADEGLEGLNFETLLAPGAQARPHFWVEDADIINGRSISLLGASALAGKNSQRPQQRGGRKRLLLVGDPVYDRPEYGQLSHAAEEVSLVTQHFSPSQRLVLTGARATPLAFQASQPGNFAYIHFVAHGTASELNPLDSSVILSTQPGQPNTYRLYARRILEQPLTADLVTISACYGSGVRSYSGEGLVGLAWAFLHAGSHNVVGALWEVSDVSTPQLMSDLYDGLAHGESPDRALRTAKLAMIQRSGVFRKPFYWAAFQLYAGA